MFITRKEFEETKKDIKSFASENGKDVTELKNMVLSLAKEIGYTWESEAVKDDGMEYIASEDRMCKVREEKAVLKWGWKKKEEVETITDFQNILALRAAYNYATEKLVSKYYGKKSGKKIHKK